ncbi:MAG: 6-phosphofructokinase [Dehalococcoidia bacterium]|nr:MAG: 6-phosphofructokinase [Dehalococcoidia bacterium]
MSMIKRIGVLTSGGDAPGMNAAIRAVVRCAAANSVEVLGIRRGYAGLLDREIVELGPRSVANVIHRGGTLLGTARCEEMKTPQGLRKAADNIESLGIEGLVAIGGDGTFRGAQALSELTSIHVVGVPGTIDNDLYGTDATIGFDTAVNTALEAIDRIRDTAEAHQRLFFVEVMGRTRGFIALSVGVAGGAEDVLVPEVRTDLDALSASISAQLAAGKRASIVVVAEGDDAGHAFEIAEKLGHRLVMDYRVCVLGHVQRGGAPSAQDRLLASKLGAGAVLTLVEGRSGVMLGLLNGKVVETPFEKTWATQKDLDTELLYLMKVLAR